MPRILRMYAGEIVMVIGVIIVVIGLLLPSSHEEARDAFVTRCEAKGGVVLRGYRGTSPWLGCYAGFEELENEQ